MDFQTSVLNIDEITKQVSVTVPKERVAKEYEISVVQAGRSVKINGFRQGKVPRHMIEKLMGIGSASTLPIVSSMRPCAEPLKSISLRLLDSLKLSSRRLNRQSRSNSAQR